MQASVTRTRVLQVALHVVLPFLEGSVRAAGEKLLWSRACKGQSLFYLIYEQLGARSSKDVCMLQVALHVVLPFLEGSVRAAGEKLRTAAVVKSLQKAEHQRAREELAQTRQRCGVRQQH